MSTIIYGIFWGFMAEKCISNGSAVIKRLRTSDLKNYKYTTNIYELVPAGNKRTKIIWQKTIVKLVEQTKQIIANQEERKRHCSWIGHTLRKRSNRITKVLHLNSQGARNRGRPRSTRTRELETYINHLGRTWEELQETAEGRPAWHESLECLVLED